LRIELGASLPTHTFGSTRRFSVFASTIAN
jgi:hypothetical protein